jgi:hypothetical protein
MVPVFFLRNPMKLKKKQWHNRSGLNILLYWFFGITGNCLKFSSLLGHPAIILWFLSKLGNPVPVHHVLWLMLDTIANSGVLDSSNQGLVADCDNTGYPGFTHLCGSIHWVALEGNPHPKLLGLLNGFALHDHLVRSTQFCTWWNQQSNRYTLW